MATKFTFNPLTGQLNASPSTLVSNNVTQTATKTLYVDGSRTDTYTADGTFYRPFKTVQAAVNQVITNADNSSTISYLIDIIGAGTYAETVDIGNSNIVNIFFDGHYAATVNGFQSLANNTNQATVGIANMNIGTFNFQCPTNNGNLGSNEIYTYQVSITGTITLNNIQNIFFTNTQALGAVTATNVNFGGWVDGYGLKSSGSLTLVTNNGIAVPSGFGGTFWICESSQNNGNTSIDAGSTFVADESSMIATSSSKTITVNGLYRSLFSLTRASITVNSGGTYRAEGGATHTGSLTINAGGSYTSTGHFGIASVEIGGASESTNAILTYKDGHHRSTQTTAPTTTINANAGTGASSSVSNATDTAGTLSLTTTAVAPSSGVQTKVNFNKAYNVAPIVVITASNAPSAQDAVLRGVYVTSTVNDFSINFAVAETVGTTYTWTYHVIETQ